jgi:hypothetical protein
MMFLMQDNTERRRQLIEHLETAANLADALDQPTTGYLIERAIEEARAQAVVGS